MCENVKQIALLKWSLFSLDVLLLTDLPLKWISHLVYKHIKAKLSLPKTILGNKNVKWYSTNGFESHFPVQEKTRNVANELRPHDGRLEDKWCCQATKPLTKSGTGSSRAWKRGSTGIVLIEVTNRQ